MKSPFCVSVLSCSVAGLTLWSFWRFDIRWGKASTRERNEGYSDLAGLPPSYEIQMAAHVKTGSTWISMMLGKYVTLHYAPVEPLRACNVSEQNQWKAQWNMRQHCCVYYFRLPSCSEDTHAMPLFSGDRHLQRLIHCTFNHHRVKCKYSMKTALQRLPSYMKKTTRFFLLVRDPRDVTVSWYYYMCYKDKGLIKQQGKMHQRDQNGSLTNESLEWRDSYSFCDSYASLLDPRAIPYVLANLQEAITWYSEFDETAKKFFRHYMVVYYEDFQADAAVQLSRLLRFLGYQNATSSDALVQEAVRFSSFDHFRQIEHTNLSGATSTNVVSVLASTEYKRVTFTPGNVSDFTSYHARNGSRGQWRWEFSQKLQGLALAQMRNGSDLFKRYWS